MGLEHAGNNSLNVKEMNTVIQWCYSPTGLWPTERPPPVSEASANFCGQKGVTWSVQRIPTAVNLCLPNLDRYLFYSSSSSIDLTRLTRLSNEYSALQNSSAAYACVSDYAFSPSNFCGQDTVSAVIASHTFHMYGPKNYVANEAKTLGLKCLQIHGTMSNSGHVQQQLVSSSMAALFAYERWWCSLNSAQSVSQNTLWLCVCVMSHYHLTTEYVYGHAFCFLF